MLTRHRVLHGRRPTPRRRLASSIGCFLAACLIASSGIARAEQGCPSLDPHIKGWPQGAVVFYDAEGLPLHVRVQVVRAFDKWNAANRVNASGVAFKPKDEAHAATFFFRVGDANGDPAKTDIIKSDTQTVLQAFTTIDVGSRINYDPRREGYNKIFEKIALHEIGHTMGLSDVPLSSRVIECGGQSSAKSVMNFRCGVNDFGNNMPAYIPACDRKAVKSNPQYKSSRQ